MPVFQSIVFIDEIDAVGTKRYDSNSGGEREIQRTMLELLNQLDGFDSRGDVKVFILVVKFSFFSSANKSSILLAVNSTHTADDVKNWFLLIGHCFKVLMATNRIDSLDPALIRPGRIDRKIEFPLPDEKTKRRIFQIHTSRMTLADDVNLDEFVTAKDELSGADIKVNSCCLAVYAYKEVKNAAVFLDFALFCVTESSFWKYCFFDCVAGYVYGSRSTCTSRTSNESNHG